MPLFLHHKHRALMFLALAPFQWLAAADAQEESLDEFEALMAEADALLQALEEPEAASEWESLFSGSVRTGVGGSSNFLKRRVPEESLYLQLEMDAYLAWGNESTTISSLFFAEASLYDYDLEPSEESLAMLQVTGLRRLGTIDLGAQMATTIGSLIYDSSLTDFTAPVGTRIEQFIPSLMIYSDWYASTTDRFRLSLRGERSEFSIEGQDYWSPGMALEWEHLWHPALRTTSTLEFERQIYDDEVGRQPDGSVLATIPALTVNRFSFQERVTWDPETWKWLTLDLYLGMAREAEDDGQYEALKQGWIGVSLRIRNSWGQFRIRGRWSEYRYDHRYVYPERYPPDTRPNLQTMRGLSVEYLRSLPWWGLSAVARLQWNSLKSRVREDSYSERRGEVLLEWSY